jgi:hypothetical protein
MKQYSTSPTNQVCLEFMGSNQYQKTIMPQVIIKYDFKTTGLLVVERNEYSLTVCSHFFSKTPRKKLKVYVYSPTSTGSKG